MTFDPNWLRLREPFDHAARTERLVRGLPGGTVLELACGLGSGARWLAPRLPAPTEWILVDHDPALLAALPAEMTGFGRPWRALQADVRDLDTLPSADLVSLQALLDLCSWDWLTAFADWLARHRTPLVAGLSVDGRVSWSPHHPLDAEIEAAFRLHQLGDRGFGASPGPLAGALLADLLRVRGYRVHTARADWVIREASMLRAMIDGHAHAAAETHPSPARVETWRQARLSRLARTTLRVGHLDLVARDRPRRTARRP